MYQVSQVKNKWFIFIIQDVNHSMTEPADSFQITEDIQEYKLNL